MLSILNGCATLFTSEHELFRITDVYYRSWAIKDLEKGTDVILELMKLDDSIEFTSLIFRDIEVDVNITTDGRKTIVKGTINTGPSLIENYEYEATESGDMIKYKYRGAEFSYPLKNIRREKTKFID
ncbi:MAG: hypothetical protein JW965_06710 [Bacteroidales bacterium]|nr:hypothetical protein [Bacteroidales bacterium]